MNEDNEITVDLHISSPEVTPIQTQLLAMFYQAVTENKIGLAQMLDLDTGKQEMVLVGLEWHPDGMRYLPLALVLDAAQALRYVPLEASEDLKLEEEVEGN